MLWKLLVEAVEQRKARVQDGKAFDKNVRDMGVRTLPIMAVTHRYLRRSRTEHTDKEQQITSEKIYNGKDTQGALHQSRNFQMGLFS